MTRAFQFSKSVGKYKAPIKPEPRYSADEAKKSPPTTYAFAGVRDNKPNTEKKKDKVWQDNKKP